MRRRPLFLIVVFILLPRVFEGGEEMPGKKLESPGHYEASISLFDGKTLKGWQGDEKWFRVKSGAIVGGSLSEKIPHNFFLASETVYDNFELNLEFQLEGEATNAGIQLRSHRLPDHHEMIGYQADLGQSYWGCLYDESRRNRVLSGPDPDKVVSMLKTQDWNRYRILCEGRRIRLWINDFQTVDYTEADESIPQRGLIALQIHGGAPGEARYRNIHIRRLSSPVE